MSEVKAGILLNLSLSARRAWIEMDMRSFGGADCSVALRKESVDRNGIIHMYKITDLSRSPQGERG